MPVIKALQALPVQYNPISMSSKPVAQLAAVFSQPSTTYHQTQTLPLMIQLPQQPVPASELGMTVPYLQIVETGDQPV